MKPKSIRSFIGAKDFNLSRQFYSDLGFIEYIVSDNMSYFSMEGFGFYLQDYFIEEWVNNSMFFLEVDDVELHLLQIRNLDLPRKYKNVKLSEMQYNEWGIEFFLHDPSGVLWHIGSFADNR